MHKLFLTEENGQFLTEHINTFGHSVNKVFSTEEKRNDYIQALEDYCFYKSYNLQVKRDQS